MVAVKNKSRKETITISLIKYKVALFFHSFLLGVTSCQKVLTTTRQRRAGQGGIGRQGKGEPEWLATLFGNEFD